MSLPTYALFVKDEKFVGVGMTNIGLFFDGRRLPHTMRRAMDDAWSRYQEDFKPNDWSKRDDHYFTNQKDLASFQYMVLYDFIIPYEVAMKVYAEQYTDDEWKDIFLRLRPVSPQDREVLREYQLEAKKRIVK